MAKQVTVTLIDDFDGRSKANETVHFAIDGVTYEIDLSTANAGKLRKSLEPWTASARKAGRLKKAGGRRGSMDREQSAAVRKWARKHGHTVSERGRISAEVLEAYNNAN
ncbi:Lsr2 family protein [Nocardia sp. NPDC057030]|uniref:histone-like nucleoid-structuring protein Lsr2 n=1 Tax=unclassified Nocardia TaxID=2637762 RepID=UPI003638AB75